MQTALTDSYDFEKIITNGNIYVDKTGILYELITSRTASRYFIARPRRFGKSLMLSTLEAIFTGRKELFVQCEIYSKQYAWERYPVIHLDMSSVLGDNVDELKSNLVNLVRRLAEKEGIAAKLPADGTHSACFASYLDVMSQKHGKRLVVLVDEYDAPANRLIENEMEAEAVRKVLHDFYTQLKVFDSCIRFLMMTGVSKFAKLSVFSGLNNLKDLTLEESCAGLLGYTVPEIQRYFGEQMEYFACQEHISADEVLARLLDWYDGYRFSPYSDVNVTNPVSLASALNGVRLGGFWEETGHSLLIYSYLKKRGIVPLQLNGTTADKIELDFYDLQNPGSPALLFQTGYLTIDKPLNARQLQFKIPNKEVEEALNAGMLAYILKDRRSQVLGYMEEAKEAFKTNPEECVQILNKTLIPAFSAVPYDWQVKDEAEAKRLFLFYCSLMGAAVIGEVHSNKGRADAVLTVNNTALLFEFKFNRSAMEALNQAVDGNYAAPFMNAYQTIYLVGVNYSSSSRTIDPPEIRKIES